MRAEHTAFDQSITLPAIAHIIIDQQLLHYVVIHKISKDKIIIADPGKGLVTYQKDDFFKIWTGILILLAPTETYKNRPRQVI